MKNLNSPSSFSLLALIAALSLSWPVSTAGQAGQNGSGEFSSDARLNPPGPVAPATMVRTDQGRVTVRAVRLTEPLNVDGVLDERSTVGSGIPELETRAFVLKINRLLRF